MDDKRNAFATSDALVLAAIRLTRTLRAMSRSADLSESEISALAVIVYAKGVPARDLAKLEEVTPATISRLVTALERKGLVRRVTDREDARLQWLFATTEGARRIRTGHARRLAPLAKAVAKLPPDKRARLEAALPVFNDLISEVQASATRKRA